MNNQVEAKLRSIGKGIFVKYYYEFKNATNHDQQQLAVKLLNENPKASSIQAQKTRISNAKSIFENNLQLEALKSILHSKVDAITLEKVKKLIQEEK